MVVLNFLPERPIFPQKGSQMDILGYSCGVDFCRSRLVSRCFMFQKDGHGWIFERASEE